MFKKVTSLCYLLVLLFMVSVPLMAMDTRPQYVIPEEIIVCDPECAHMYLRDKQQAEPVCTNYGMSTIPDEFLGGFYIEVSIPTQGSMPIISIYSISTDTWFYVTCDTVPLHIYEFAMNVIESNEYIVYSVTSELESRNNSPDMSLAASTHICNTVFRVVFEMFHLGPNGQHCRRWQENYRLYCSICQRRTGGGVTLRFGPVHNFVNQIINGMTVPVCSSCGFRQ